MHSVLQVVEGSKLVLTEHKEMEDEIRMWFCLGGH